MKGRAAVLEISHFSYDFRTPKANILVYKKNITFKPTPNIPMYSGILQQKCEESMNKAPNLWPKCASFLEALSVKRSSSFSNS